MKSIKVAVQGCCHGELNSIYNRLPPAIDLLIITGDFQALRNLTDLKCMSVPDKYKKMGHFYQYYQGIKKAPVLTIFIGGNHESSSYLQELKYGGWVAPNIYYLGEFGVVWYRGLRIGGISGIFNDISFTKNPRECLPYNESEIRSVFHVKPKTYVKMMLMKDHQTMDIGLSHDWPQYIYNYGDLEQLVRLKPFFKRDIDSGKLGSPLAKNILNVIKPKYWFSSHLHVFFEARVKQITATNSEEIDIDLDMDVSDDINLETLFLALDKCGKKRRHLKILTIPGNENHISYKSDQLFYDNRAIVVNRVVENTKKLYLNNYTLDHHQLESLKGEISLQLNNMNDLYTVPKNFRAIAPGGFTETPLQYWPNNQTQQFIDKFKMPQATQPTPHGGGWK